MQNCIIDDLLAKCLVKSKTCRIFATGFKQNKFYGKSKENKRRSASSL